MSQVSTKFIKNLAVTNTKLAQMAAHTYKGNNTGSTANAADITSTQLTADLNLFTSSLQGLVPASGGGTVNFLRADGTWQSSTGTGLVVLATSPTVTGASLNGAGTIIQTFAVFNDVTDATKQLQISTSGNGTGIKLTLASTSTTSQILQLPNITTTDTLVALALAQTLTNKTIAAGSNTITGLTNTNLSGSAAITNANLAAMATNTFKANNTGGSATPTDITTAQALTMLGIRAGKTTITTATTTVSVTFSSTLGTTSYAIAANFLNTTDTNPQFQAVDITAQSATGFTATWNAPVDSGNYVLSWTAIVNN